MNYKNSHQRNSKSPIFYDRLLDKHLIPSSWGLTEFRENENRGNCEIISFSGLFSKKSQFVLRITQLVMKWGLKAFKQINLSLKCKIHL